MKTRQQRLDEAKMRARMAVDGTLDEFLPSFYPEAEHGDVDPMSEARFKQALDALIESWVIANVPEECIERGDMDFRSEFGTVVEATEKMIRVKLAKHFEVLDGWDNELIWTIEDIEGEYEHVPKEVYERGLWEVATRFWFKVKE